MSALAPQHSHLYYIWDTCWDYCSGHPGRGCNEVRTCEVTRVTAKRIYFHGSGPKWRREREFFVDRAAIEAEGYVWHNGMRERLHLKPPTLRDYHRPKPLAELRREMADHHPDRGGDPAEFRAAHARYAAVKGMR